MSRFAPPPRAIGRARLDNISIVPASLLPQKARYQALANTLPQGDVLVVLPAADSRQRQAIERTIAVFRAKGHQVTTMEATSL